MTDSEQNPNARESHDPTATASDQGANQSASAAGRPDAEHLDATDPLGSFRRRFDIPDDTLVYLDGNSLGRLPATTSERLRHVVEEQWGDRLIRSWDEGWLALPAQVGDRLGTSLLGARQGETLVCDNVTANIFKLLHAALDLRPDRSTILMSRHDFPTDRYVASEVARQRGGLVSWIGPLDPDATAPTAPVRAIDIAPQLDDQVAVLLLSVVDYRSGALVDVAGITDLVHRAGALVIWDCSHAVGVVPLDLPTIGADFAVGCSYKYLNGGPGSPGWLWVNEQLHAQLGTPAIPGWLGHADAFAMGRNYLPADGVRRFLTGSPSPLLLGCVEEGASLVAEAGITAIRAKSELLTGYAVQLAQAWLVPLGVRLGSPTEPHQRGSHIIVHHPDAPALCQALIDRGVIPDFRQPDGIRIGLSPLTTRFTDVYDGMAALYGLVSALQEADGQRPRG
jgi:kynureninase